MYKEKGLGFFAFLPKLAASSTIFTVLAVKLNNWSFHEPRVYNTDDKKS